MKFYNRIVFRVSILFIVLVVVPIFALQGTMTIPMKNRMMQQIDDHNLLIATRLKTDVEKELSHVSETTGNIATFISTREMESAEIQDLLLLGVEETELISQMFILDEVGEKVITSSGELGDRSDRAYFKIAIEGTSNFSETLISRSTGLPITVHAVPLYDGNEIIGVLCSVIEIDFISEVAKSINDEEDIEVFIVDQIGNLIADSEKEELTELINISDNRAVQAVISGENGNRRFQTDEYDLLVTYIQFDTTDWGLIISQKTATAYNELYKMKDMTIVVLSLALFIVFFGIGLVIRAVRKPLITFESVIKEIINGNLDVEVPEKLLKRTDEIGVFAKLQTRMLISINELIDKVENSNVELNAIVESSEDVFFRYRIDTDEFVLSEEAKKVLGIDLEYTNSIIELLKEHMDRVDSDEFCKLWNEVLNGEKNTVKIEVSYNVNNYTRIYRFTILRYVSHSSGNENIVTAIKDITVEARQKNALMDKLYKHPVTGMSNRIAVTESLDRILKERVDHVYVWVLDITNFRYINGNFGFEAGNELLKKLRDVLLDMEDLYLEVAHLEGDRFCMILKSDINVNFVSMLLEKKINRIEVNGYEYLLSGCSGVAKSGKGEDAERVIRKAEIALLKAKEISHSSCEVYDESYGYELNERLGIMNHLKKAIELHEIYMVYQPIVNSKTDKVIGYESLARWNSPQYGFVPPNVFIEMAENSGFIKELGVFICEEAIKFASKINKDTNRYTVSINVSPRQLMEENFLEMFVGFLGKYRVKPERVAIEITESVYIENLNNAKGILSELRDYGVKVYLDDFGTGYSSLSYIENLPIDILKIDKSFIDKIENDKTGGMISVFKSLADNMGIGIISEGVETKEQLAVLKQYGCYNIQGYYYSKPLLEDEIFNE